MSRQRVTPGGTLDVVTPDELYRAIPRPEQTTRIRVPGSIPLNGVGAGVADIYKVPTGMAFEVRRIFFTLTGNTPSDPNSGAVALNAVGKWIAYLRSGNVIEYANPQYGFGGGVTSSIQVPGVQTWGSEQGMFLSNGEVFSIQAAGLTPNLILSMYMEGILTRPREGG